jgi:hypothetical protein
MNRTNLFFGLFTTLVIYGVTAAAAPIEQTEAKEIPLDQISAWNIPGTKDVGTLDAVKFGGVTKHPVIQDISGGLGFLPKEKKAAPVFVVEGEGKTALVNASAVFKKAKPRSETLRADTELSLVFYSHGCSSQVELVSVEKSASLISVKYRFLVHGLPAKRIYFALIPIGKFAPGTVEVKIEQQDSTDLAGHKKPPIRSLERLISSDLTFEVRK